LGSRDRFPEEFRVLVGSKRHVEHLDPVIDGPIDALDDVSQVAVAIAVEDLDAADLGPGVDAQDSGVVVRRGDDARDPRPVAVQVAFALGILVRQRMADQVHSRERAPVELFMSVVHAGVNDTDADGLVRRQGGARKTDQPGMTGSILEVPLVGSEVAAHEMTPVALGREEYVGFDAQHAVRRQELLAQGGEIDRAFIEDHRIHVAARRPGSLDHGPQSTRVQYLPGRTRLVLDEDLTATAIDRALASYRVHLPGALAVLDARLGLLFRRCLSYGEGCVEEQAHASDQHQAL